MLSAQLRTPYKLRGTSPVRNKGRRSFLNEEEYPRMTAASQPQYRSRNSRTGGQHPTTASWGGDKRPWTVGEFDGHSMDSLAAFGKAGKAGLLRRVRSAEDSSSTGLSSPNRQRGFEFSSGPGEVSNDAGSGNGNDCVESTGAVSSAAPPQFVRRVSFADGRGDFFLEELDDSDFRPKNSRRLSSLIDGGYSGIDLAGGRRASDIERQHHAMELVRAAHELMFTDTRPDGLRPITGSPMTNGRGVGGSGGLFVGLAGLRGFDLSFVGAAPTQGGERLRARLSHRSAEIDAPAPTSTKDERRAGSPPPASEVDVSWLEQGFLLGREPGSLMPRVPGEDAALGDSASVGSDIGMESGPGRPLTPPFQDPTSAGVSSVLEGGGSPRAETDAKTKHVQRNRTGEGVGGPGSRKVGALSRSGVTAVPVPAESAANISAEEVSTAAPTAAAAALFAPQAAVLWSPANVSIDDLVLTVASRRDRQVSLSLFEQATIRLGSTNR